MPRIKTHEDFLGELILKNKHFNNGLFVLLGKYKAEKIHLLAKDKYGLLMVTPGTLLKGRLPTIESAKDKTSYLKNKVLDKFPNYFDNIVVKNEYVNQNIPLLLETPYGLCESYPSNMLKGVLPTIITAVNKHDYFLKLFKHKQADNFNAVEILSTYIHSDNYLTIKFKNNIYNITPKELLQGKLPSVYNCIIKSKTEIFIENCNNKHNFKYIYNKTKYIKGSKNVTITCPKHGDFSQRASNHLLGIGCKHCSLENIGWSYTKWEKAGKCSRNFKGFSLYIIQCQDSDKELFYKIGKTFQDLQDRFQKTFPYNYLEILVKKGSAENISKLETKLQKLHKQYKYVPKLKFKGMYECFSEIDLSLIKLEILKLENN